MAKTIFRAPLAEVRWAHLITPRHQLDRSKPKAWTCDLLLPNGDEKAQAFLLAMEDQFIALHGSRKRRAVQVVEFVPYEQVDPTDGFEEVDGYTTTAAAAASGWATDGDDDEEAPF